MNKLLWQEGIEIPVEVGCSIKELLCEQLGIDEDYLQKRITVIFLDSSPVDDIDSAIVSDRSVVALSAQLPGLVGAAMSRKGLISPFRSSISAKAKEKATKSKGTIRLKLFNALIDELGTSISKKFNLSL